MNSLDKQYTDLLQTILDFGVEKKDRTGTGTKSIFGYTIRHNMKDGFPLLTTKKMYTKAIITELLWFLRGDTNIKFLVDNDCHIWDGDAYKRYWNSIETSEYDGFGPTSIKLPTLTKEEFINKIKTDDEFAKKWGDLGKIYGFQWRNWGSEEILVEKSFVDDEGFGYKRKVKEQTKGIDQISELIKQLKDNPDSRRMVVNAWAVHDLPNMTLPPCHYGFQVYTRELSLEERLCIADKFNPLIREDCLTKTHHPDETEELKSQYRHEWLDSLGPNVVPQRRAISLMFNMRSTDVGLGLPFNIASYGLLLEIIAKAVNMVPGQLIGNLGDTHLYLNHIEQAKEQIGRELRIDERVCMCYENPKLDLTRIQEGMSDDEFKSVCDGFNIPTRTRVPYPLPTLKINSGNENWYLLDIDEIVQSLDTDITFKLENYQSHPTIKMPLSN
jgi:thymidylate synthase